MIALWAYLLKTSEHSILTMSQLIKAASLWFGTDSFPKCTLCDEQEKCGSMDKILACEIDAKMKSNHDRKH